MVGKIFINYRRNDDPGFTQALYLRLEQEFPASDLFMDIEGHIKPGDDFASVLNSQVAFCAVFLVVIGPRWGELMSARAADLNDFVVIEIKAALDQGKRVIPVLVGGATMPRADDLPKPIEVLARRNAVGLRPERFKADCQGLVSALKEHLASAERERIALTEAERAAAEAKRQKRETDEAARIAAAEERGQEHAVAGISAAEVRKAEELANWDFIKERGDAQALRDHLARFPRGVTALYAQTRLEDLVWDGMAIEPTEDQLTSFLQEFPQGAHSETVREQLDVLRRRAASARAAAEAALAETAAWAEASTANTLESYQTFLTTYPSGRYAAVARKRIRPLRGISAFAAVILFAIAAVTITGGSAELFDRSGWRWARSDQGSPVLAIIVTAISVVILATMIARWRDRAIRGWELFVYWLGSTLYAVTGIVIVFDAFGWKLHGSNLGPELPGLLTASAVALASAFEIVRRRQLSASSWSFVVYWICCCLIGSIAINQFYDIEFGWFGFQLLPIISGALTVALPGFVGGVVLISATWLGQANGDRNAVRLEKDIPIWIAGAIMAAITTATWTSYYLGPLSASMNTRGNQYYMQRNYIKAREWFEKAAREADPHAMHNLGLLYHYGLGVKQDYEKARELYEQAAGKGNISAATNLGIFYHQGLGVKQDYEKARSLYETAAAGHNSSAMANLAILYHYGLGVSRDLEKARSLYQKSAAMGNQTAKDALERLGGLGAK